MNYLFICRVISNNKSPRFFIPLELHPTDYKGPVHFVAIFTLPNFGKVTKKVATFSLLSNFGNYIRNPVKILASYQNFGNFAIFWQW